MIKTTPRGLGVDPTMPRLIDQRGRNALDPHPARKPLQGEVDLPDHDPLLAGLGFERAFSQVFPKRLVDLPVALDEKSPQGLELGYAPFIGARPPGSKSLTKPLDDLFAVHFTMISPLIVVPWIEQW